VRSAGRKIGEVERARSAQCTESEAGKASGERGKAGEGAEREEGGAESERGTEPDTKRELVDMLALTLVMAMAAAASTGTATSSTRRDSQTSATPDFYRAIRAPHIHFCGFT
jgi:hypothetical protein